MQPFFCLDKEALHKQGIFNMTNAQIHGPDLCFIVHQTNDQNSIGDTLASLLYYPISQSLYYDAENPIVYHCECPRDAKNPVCNKKNMAMGLFYDKELSTSHYNQDTGVITTSIPTNQIKFALILQKYLLDDPINGDLKIQEHFLEFFGSAYFSFLVRDILVDNVTITNKANVSVNATFGDLHAAKWKEICPWGTCGSFVFNIQSDSSVDAFLSMNRNMYQAGFAPFVNGTYKKTTEKIKTTYYYFNNTKHDVYTNSNYSQEMTRLHGSCDHYNSTTSNCTHNKHSYINTILKTQMCENTVYDSAVMDSFINTSPVAVVQPYFQCRKTAKAALFDAVGNAAGTAGTWIYVYSK